MDALQTAVHAGQKADAADSKITAHEAACIERMKRIEEFMTRIDKSIAGVRTSVSGLYNRFWLAAVALIGLLASGLIYFIARYGIMPAAS